MRFDLGENVWLKKFLFFDGWFRGNSIFLVDFLVEWKERELD